MEPDDIASSPYKPGTKEHSLWIKSNVISKQLDQSTIAWASAKTIADDRLLRLAEKYHTNVVSKALALEQMIASLPVNPKFNPTVIDPANSHLLELLADVNATWEKTKLGVTDGFYKFVPFINQAPNWIGDEQLYLILQQVCSKQWEPNYLHSWIRFSVREPFQGLKALIDPTTLVVSQVEVGFKKYVRY